MSHNVTVEGVVFDDLETLERTFKALQQRGLIQPNAIFHKEAFSMRGYGGRNEKVDLGIALPSESYDVGFRRTAEGFVPYFEHGFFPKGITADAGAQDINGQTCSPWGGPAVVGKLSQEYRLQQLERNANRNGLQTRRIQKDKGQVALEIVHR